MIVNYGDQCAYVGVRHRYDPVWSMNNYYTAWAGGPGHIYRDEEAPVLLFIQTEAF